MNSTDRSFESVGKTIYIGDEYKHIKYKDKVELEIKLKDFHTKKEIKLLFYIIKKKSQIEKDGRLFKYTSAKKNEIKFFFTSSQNEIEIFHGNETLNPQQRTKLSEFIQLTIPIQLGSDLYDTAIWDIYDYLFKSLCEL